LPGISVDLITCIEKPLYSVSGCVDEKSEAGVKLPISLISIASKFSVFWFGVSVFVLKPFYLKA